MHLAAGNWKVKKIGLGRGQALCQVHPALWGPGRFMADPEVQDATEIPGLPLNLFLFH